MKKVSLVLALILVLSTLGCAAAAPTAIQASGQIEAQQISIAPELSGRVVDVLVNEGDAVRSGDPLLKLDDSLLLSQQKAAQAALDAGSANIQAAQAGLEVSQAQYDQVLSAALAEDQAGRQNEWKLTKPGEFDQPVWYFSKQEAIQSAQAEVDAAKTALDDVQARLAQIEDQAGSARLLNAEKKLSDARMRFQIAKKVLDLTNGAGSGADLRSAAQTTFDNANTDLKNAQKDYDDALTTDGAKDVLKARANLEVATERYYTALDAQRALQTGENSLSVAAAVKTVDLAKATLAQAQSTLTAAQANLDQIGMQLDKLTIRAPMDGVVLVRSIDTGEVIQAGMTAMTLAKLDTLKVTVYLPEDQYGKIVLGQNANLSVDSFTNETFSAAVTNISDQAEFTPQNVQTKEGRQTTVYAVELTLDNPGGKLKPGMPVDVSFASKPAG